MNDRMSEALSRSSRVRRGFNRLAFVGLAAGAISVVVFLGFAAAQYPRGLLVKTAAGYQTVPDEVTPSAGNRIQTKYGSPQRDYFDLAVNSGPQEAFPYQTQLEREHDRKASNLQGLLGMAAFSGISGAVWAGLILLLSWLVRGFMA